MSLKKPYEMIQEFTADKLMTDDTKFGITKLVEAAIAYERERCAKVVEEHSGDKTTANIVRGVEKCSYDRCSCSTSSDPLQMTKDEPKCTCTIDGSTFCEAQGTGYCLAENPERAR